MTRQHAGQARHCLPAGPATYLVGGAVPAARRHQRSRSVLRDVPALHTRLATAGLPGPAADQVVARFRVCFHDHASQNDPTAVPASCRRIQQRVAAAPAPTAVKEAVATAVTGRAIPLARKDDFTRSLQHALLFWQIPAFLLAGLLVFALPKVKPSSTVPGGA